MDIYYYILNNAVWFTFLPCLEVPLGAVIQLITIADKDLLTLTQVQWKSSEENTTSSKKKMLKYCPTVYQHKGTAWDCPR